MKQLLKTHYGLSLKEIMSISQGAGGESWIAFFEEGKYIVKFPGQSEMDHPEAEPALCQYLLSRHIPSCRFVPNRQGDFFTRTENGKLMQVKHFEEGTVYPFHQAPPWLIPQAAQMLGRIHHALRTYQGLSEGIGERFFRYMTPERALRSHRATLAIALERKDLPAAEDLQFRIRLLENTKPYLPPLSRLTCLPTHGDYGINQLVCGKDHIHCVIDWTSACIHPVAWEIIRSFVYADPSCRDGRLSPDALKAYTAAYMEYSPLTSDDLAHMVPLFYYQSLVCDFYGQYYASSSPTRSLFRHQASFTTALLRSLTFQQQEITNALLALLAK